MIYSKDDVKRMLKGLHQDFEGRLSNPDDCIYNDILKKLIKRIEAKL